MFVAEAQVRVAAIPYVPGDAKLDLGKRPRRPRQKRKVFEA
jgi:hypothetical protein